ncbi:DUF2852 domain-containing protein [Paragemmobacter straminiformis]|uniref:DUF2852 domain-containing protein n=1 Tax=Paragemmobacter straminiformis TaxID=2045119 RepID=A0A842I8D0_9RHOB|nr:DUF2852 domain-containing protein [Gemmobacter straminiformis]MBC2835334.1 DUF2852 domain-containing protein [Gemmobacter straminiformis]
MSYTTHTAPRFGSRLGGILSAPRRVEAWLDDRGKPAWIAAMVLAFIFVWPVGLALLAYMIWSKRMFNRSCRHSQSHSRSAWGGGVYASSGNSAFDAYKAETLRRLEEEQAAFEGFLQRLREAKDKSEFDAFMEDRSRKARGEGDAPQAQA